MHCVDTFMNNVGRVWKVIEIQGVDEMSNEVNGKFWPERLQHLHSLNIEIVVANWYETIVA